MIRGHIEINSL